MEGIVRYLRDNNCDIVFLQEIWVSSDFDIIREGTKDLYKFAHLFRSGSVLGSSGIVILSKWFPKVIHFEPYSLNGSPFYPWHGDWFAGKGIAYSRVDFDGLSLHLFSTHTHAYYKENEPIHDQYSVHRVCQSYQLAKFINFISDTSCNRRGSNYKDLLIVAGDMNCTSSELPYKIVTTMANLTDCFKTSRYTNPSSNIIHKHKILTYMQKLYYNNVDTNSNQDDASIDTNSSCNISNNQFKIDDDCFHENNQSSLGLRARLNENFLLDTLANYRAKISQVLFDSDTEDEDITYCHPRNSFTPGAVLNGGIKTNKTTISHSGSTSTNDSCSKVEADNLSTGKISNFEKNSSSHSSTKPMLNIVQSNTETQPKKSIKKSPMKRIDFILCRLLTHGQCIVDRIASESKDTTINCSLSDHEPVMVELKICDISHDLIKKNNLIAGDEKSYNSTSISHVQSSDRSTRVLQSARPKFELSTPNEKARPLASIVESKVSLDDANDIEETTSQWVPEQTPINLSYQNCNAQVMLETRDILNQYYKYNKSSKKQLFYIISFMFIITLPTVTYYALANELIPISTIIFMWFASLFLFAIGLLIGFLSYRFEQGAIEAILNDMKTSIKACNDIELNEVSA